LQHQAHVWLPPCKTAFSPKEYLDVIVMMDSEDQVLKWY
jgi:hypothetical protein